MALPQRQTKTEIDDDVGRRKGRRTKTEAEEDGDRRRGSQTHSGVKQSDSSPSADYPGVTRTELNISPPMRLADSRAHEGCSSRCSSLCSPRASRRTAPVASFLNLLSVKRIAKERRQSPQVVPTGLTED